MVVETSYTQLREHLASTLDRVADDQEIVIVRRKRTKQNGSRDVALIPATELAGLLETAHLFRSERNAERLLEALRDAEQGKGKPATIDELKRDVGFAEEE